MPVTACPEKCRATYRYWWSPAEGAGFWMSAANLITRLLQIERALGKSHSLEIRNLVLEAQGCVLELEQQLIETLRENERLRERMERCGHFSYLPDAGEAPPMPSEQALSFSQIADELSQVLGRKRSGSEKRSFSEAVTDAAQ